MIDLGHFDLRGLALLLCLWAEEATERDCGGHMLHVALAGMPANPVLSGTISVSVKGGETVAIPFSAVHGDATIGKMLEE